MLSGGAQLDKIWGIVPRVKILPAPELYGTHNYHRDADIGVWWSPATRPVELQAAQYASLVPVRDVQADGLLGTHPGQLERRKAPMEILAAGANSLCSPAARWYEARLALHLSTQPEVQSIEIWMWLPYALLVPSDGTRTGGSY